MPHLDMTSRGVATGSTTGRNGPSDWRRFSAAIAGMLPSTLLKMVCSVSLDRASTDTTCMWAAYCSTTPALTRHLTEGMPRNAEAELTAGGSMLATVCKMTGSRDENVAFVKSNSMQQRAGSSAQPPVRIWVTDGCAPARRRAAPVHMTRAARTPCAGRPSYSHLPRAPEYQLVPRAHWVLDFP